MPHRNANHCSQELLVPEAMVCISAVRLRWWSGQFIPRHLASAWSVLKSPASLAMKRRCGIAEQRRRDLGLGEPGDVSHRLLSDGGLETFRHQRTAVSDHGDVLEDAVGGRVPGDRYGLPIQDNDSLSEGHCPRCLHGGTQFTDCCRGAENAVRKGECTHVQDINRIFSRFALPCCLCLLHLGAPSAASESRRVCPRLFRCPPTRLQCPARRRISPIKHQVMPYGRAGVRHPGNGSYSGLPF